MSRKRTPHTSAPTGKRVRLVLRTGGEVEGRFLERTGQFVVLDTGRFRGKDIQRFFIVKGVGLTE